jgi:hypothetical protein
LLNFAFVGNRMTLDCLEGSCILLIVSVIRSVWVKFSEKSAPWITKFVELSFDIGEKCLPFLFVMKIIQFPRWLEVLEASDLPQQTLDSFKVTLRWSRKRLRLTRS